MAGEKDCAFCKIINHELPEFKIYEDEKYLAFLSIDPKAIGHTILVPKKHCRWVHEIPEIGEFFEVGRKISRACMKGMKSETVSFLTLGMQVPHAGLWIIPRNEGDHHGKLIDFSVHLHFSKEQYEAIAEKIRQSF